MHWKEGCLHCINVWPKKEDENCIFVAIVLLHGVHMQNDMASQRMNIEFIEIGKKIFT